MAGLAPGQGAALSKVDKDWQVNGKFGVVQWAHEPGREAMDRVAEQVEAGRRQG